MAEHRWLPAVQEQWRGVQPGGVVDVTPEERAYLLSVVPGANGGLCLISLDPPANIDAPAPIEAVAVEPEPAEDLAPPKRTRRGRGQ